MEKTKQKKLQGQVCAFTLLTTSSLVLIDAVFFFYLHISKAISFYFSIFSHVRDLLY